MKENFDDFMIDAKLHIRTTGRDDRFSDTKRYPYEPTEYQVLDRIVDSGLVEPDDTLLDYGCGLGRVPVYMHYRLGCRSIGVEMMQDFYEIACDNVNSYLRGDAIDTTVSDKDDCKSPVNIVRSRAEDYEVDDRVSCIYFFNPFTSTILRKAMDRVIDSYYRNPRRIRVFVYFPQESYVALLGHIPELDFIDEIDCRDVDNDPSNVERNRVLIYEFSD